MLCAVIGLVAFNGLRDPSRGGGPGIELQDTYMPPHRAPRASNSATWKLPVVSHSRPLASRTSSSTLPIPTVDAGMSGRKARPAQSDRVLPTAHGTIWMQSEPKKPLPGDAEEGPLQDAHVAASRIAQPDLATVPLS